MIHHYSIPVSKPKETSIILKQLFNGTLTLFGPHQNSYIVWFGDEFGSAIELYPGGTQMLPNEGNDQAIFKVVTVDSPYIATHAAISIDKSEEEILEFAEEIQWKALKLSRGGFSVIELWIENSVMIELLTPQMAKDYLTLTSKFISNE